MSQQTKSTKKQVTPVQIVAVFAILIVVLAGLSYIYLFPHEKPPGTMDEWNRGVAKMQEMQTGGALDRIRKMTPEARNQVRRMYPDLVKQVEQEEAAQGKHP